MGSGAYRNTKLTFEKEAYTDPNNKGSGWFDANDPNLPTKIDEIQAPSSTILQYIVPTQLYAEDCYYYPMDKTDLWNEAVFFEEGVTESTFD